MRNRHPCITPECELNWQRLQKRTLVARHSLFFKAIHDQIAILKTGLHYTTSEYPEGTPHYLLQHEILIMITSPLPKNNLGLEFTSSWSVNFRVRKKKKNYHLFLDHVHIISKWCDYDWLCMKHRLSNANAFISQQYLASRIMSRNRTDSELDNGGSISVLRSGWDTWKWHYVALLINKITVFFFSLFLVPFHFHL